ncbi:hypothetical protein DWY25_06135, partial [Holdemania filiformis]
VTHFFIFSYPLSVTASFLSFRNSEKSFRCLILIFNGWTVMRLIRRFKTKKDRMICTIVPVPDLI